MPETAEVSTGAYLFVNWDDDDGDGQIDDGGVWIADPVPDLTEDFVTDEDNLAKLSPP